MENQVEKFDPSKLMDGVRDRIKATFVSLIPDDQWEQLVKTASEKFFERRELEKDYHGRVTKYGPSEFEELVNTMMKDKCKEIIIAFINDPKYAITQEYKYNVNTQSNHQQITMSEHLEGMIKEKMPDMMQSMFSGLLSGAFYQLFQNLRNTNQLR